MVEQTEGKTPQIRFNEFEQNWKRKLLKEICEVVGGGTPSTLIPEYWGGYIDWYSPTEIGSEIYANGSVKKITQLGFEKSSAEMLPANKTILFTSRAGIGDMAILRQAGCTNQGFQSLVLHDDIDPYFIYSMGYLIKDYALKYASGSTFLEISSKQLGRMEVLLPNEKEQKKIGSYFNELDRLIGLHQRKHNKLVTLKQAMLQRMFPQNGVATPEVRFKGFNGDWEKKELQTVCEVVGGGTPSTLIREYWGGDIDWYSPTEIGSEVYANGSVKKITQLGFEKSSAKMLPANKTILFTSRAGIGDMAILRQAGCTNQGFQSLVLHDDIDPYFIYSMGYLIKDYALKYASGSTFLEISSKQLRKMDVLLPENKEQQQIGAYFRKLDELISQHSTQLGKLKQIKSACLEKMFV